METASSLRQFLEGLCSDNSPWSYAVFWRLQHFQDPMLVIYEDGYYDYNVLQLRSRSILSRFSRQEEILNIGFATDLLGEDVPECPITFANDVISCRQYLLGQGMVGRVALSGNDQWLYSKETESTEVTSYTEHHPDEWLLPVSSGIKTTLISPILPYGVLQLGSFKKVAEHFVNLTEIKERIFSLLCPTICTPPNYGETSDLWSSIQVPEWENKDESSIELFQRSHSQSAEEFDTVELADIEISTGYEFIDQFELEDFATNSMLASEMDINHLYLDLSIVSNSLNDFDIPDIPEAFETENMWTFCCTEEEYVGNTGVSSESSGGVSCYVFLEHEQQSSENDTQEVVGKTISLKSDKHSGCSFQANADSCKALNLSATSSCGWFDEGGDHDYLLEEAVATLYKNSDDTHSFMCNSSSSTEVSLEELAPSFQVVPSYETNVVLTEQKTTVSHGQCTSLSRHQSKAFDNTVMSADSYETFKSVILKDEQSIGFEYGFSHKSEKIPKHNKGRVGSKTNLRPRPRDRQLIQDRLKQLRKLVPTGTKSSIVGLLEQTTKHMTFLRGVIEQAKKVEQFGDQKLIADKNEPTPRHPDLASSAQQEGNNTESCPIIVTDMENSGQFLIQMLCNSDDVFFEMIEVMRQLNLSILQGVMEAHRNNWARFIVEASDGFNKLDIFWPLMRILQRNGDWITKMNQWCT